MKDSLVLSSADTFNDDHDISLGFDLNKAVDILSSNDQFIKTMAQETKRNKSFEERYALLKDEKGKHLIRYFVNFLFTDFIRSIKCQLLLGCFSQEYDNPTMWAHYADNNSGFVVGYEKEKIKREFKKSRRYSEGDIFLSIKYKDNVCDITDEIIQHFLDNIESNKKSPFSPRPNRTFFDNLRNDVFDYFSIKKTQWSYEKEERVIVYNSTSKGNVHIEAIKIKPSLIIIGEKMNLPNKYLISSICKQKNIPVFIVESSFSSDKHNLGIRPILFKEIDNLLDKYQDFLELDGIVN